MTIKAAMEQEYRDLSYWLDSFPGRLEPESMLSGDKTADVVIVGAGYTGLWTAYYLKQIDPSLDIAMLEAEFAGFGASGRNGGWCSGYLSGIDHWLDDSAHRESAIRLQKLMFETVREVGEIAAMESIDCHFDLSGALEIAVIDAQMDRLREETEYLYGLGFDDGDYRWLDREELRDTLNVDQSRAAIHMKHCAAIHPARLARGLADTVRKLGVDIHELSPVTAVEGRAVISPRGRVKADSIIVATEGYSDSVAGRDRILIPVHSMMVVTEPLSRAQLDGIGFRRRYCFGNLDRLVTYGQLTADNRIAFGCRGTYHLASKVRRFNDGDPEFRLVRESLLSFFPGLQGIAFTHAWGGTMGVSRNLRPSVNFDPDSRFGWAGGYFGNGVGASHLAGKTMADLVTGRDTERLHTPWVNSAAVPRRWESEPLRWLGIKSRARLMHLADLAEHRNSRLAPAIDKILQTLFPL